MAQATPEDKTGTALAMVATSTSRLPDAAEILALCGIAPARGGLFASLLGRKAGGSKGPTWQDGNLIVPCRDGQLAVSLMPAPIPWSQLEGPCATAWWWPQAKEKLRPHKFHFLVALIGGTIEPVERRVILTKAVSAVVRGTDAVGVYWGEGTLVHEPAAFVEQAQTVRPDKICGPLWLDVRIEKRPDGTLRCFTTGMAPLGFREIEVERSTLDPGELLAFIGNTSSYIVNGRIQISDGETMGRTADERYKVRYAPSMYKRPPVMRLVMT
jgi:hypothetical protein